MKNIKLLDLTALSLARPEGSIFDETYLKKLETVGFLKKLTSKISAPVMPDDQNSEYSITQAIADFLASNIMFSLSGIIYPSAQSKEASSNVILFHNSSKVEDLKTASDVTTEVEIGNYDGDGYHHGYSVYEITHLGDYKNKIEEKYSAWSALDIRSATLSLDTENITVHLIENVNYSTTAYPVERKRIHSYENDEDNPF